MRHVIRVTAVMLCSLMIFGLQPPVRAQEATPVTEITLEGATIEAGAFAPVPGSSSQRMIPGWPCTF